VALPTSTPTEAAIQALPLAALVGQQQFSSGARSHRQEQLVAMEQESAQLQQSQTQLLARQLGF
jgi:hypothetical protein